MNITPLEIEFLKEVIAFNSDYSQYTTQDDITNNPVWTPTTDNASVGVLSSLVKKKLIETDYSNAAMKAGRRSKDSQCWLTKEGAQVCANLGLLHP